MPPPFFPGAEGLGVRRWMIAVLGCLFAVWAGVTLAEQPYLVFAGLAGLLYVGTLAVNARTLAWLVVALQPAALIVPFFPGRPFWWELCALLAWPSLLAHFLVNQEQVASLRFDRLEKRALLALGGFIIVLIVLMLYRGVGFRAFGGAQMGGRFYMQQLILAIVPLLMVAADLSERRLLTATAVGWAMALTYLVSDFAFSMSGGAMQRVLYFFEVPTDAVNFVAGYELTGLRRYQSLWFAAAAGLACLWTLAPLRDLWGRYVLLAGPLMLGLLAVGLGSGHRTLLIQAMGTLFFLTLFQRYWNPLRVMVSALMVTFLVVALYATADQLPLSVQRSISFLPGIQVQELAMHNAVDTLNDRLGILKLAVNDIPRYFVVGRGFGMERLDQLPGDALYDNVWMGYVNGIFYNGTLGLLLKTGFAGFLLTSLFVWWVSRMALELVKLVWRRSAGMQSWFDRLCLLVCAQWFSLLGFFYLTHGDASLWMQGFALPAALIMVCRRRQMQTDPAEFNSSPEASPS